MKARIWKRLIGVLAALAIFGGCLAGLSAADGASAIRQNLRVQQGSPVALAGNISVDAGQEQRFHSAQALAASTGQSSLIAPTAYVAALPSIDFDDVRVGDWFYNEVRWAIEASVTNGIGNNRFGPEQTCTNAQILTFIWRAYGEPGSSVSNPFKDVAASDYFYDAALWAYEQGLVAGTELGPNKDCTRVMVVDYLWKAAGSPVVSVSTQFDDVPSYFSASTAVAWAVENGITTGVGNGLFSPYTTCTRAQIVTFLYRNDQYLSSMRETVVAPSGASYSGSMQNGQPQGRGVLNIPGVGRYDGYFANGKRCGTGTFTWNAGGTYSGAWSDDKINGEGTLTLASGDVLAGTFLNGSLSVGTYTYTQDFGTLEVTVRDGRLQPNAEVKLTTADGAVYRGYILAGKLNGACTISYANGDRYVGGVVANLKSGDGVYTWANGAWYDGDWAEDTMTGEGTYYYSASPSGERLSGTFLRNAPMFTCTYYSAANVRYITTWQDGRCVYVERG